MRTGTLAFLLGVVLFQQHASLPSIHWAWGLILLIPVGVLLKSYWHLPAWLMAGYLWSLVIAFQVMHQDLPGELEGRDLLIEGQVASLPVHSERSIRFEFDVVAAWYQGETVIIPERLRLNWYGTPPELAAGQTWQLKVRLKHPHGFMNPGGFDYEAWLFQRGIRATGYIRKGAENRQLGPPKGYWIQRLRQYLRTQLNDILSSSPMRGLVLALVVGDRSAITPEQWEVLRRTGTIHLMAISGLHIGLVAGLGFFLGRGIWCFSRRGMLWLPAPKVGAVLALVSALAYAALAGFSIPTTRALIMVIVVMSALLLNRVVSPSRSLAVAMLLVLINDPSAALSAGFWLSFGAVAVIMYGLTGRIGALSRWRQAIRVQWWVSLGLFPLLVMFFNQASLLAPFANLLAVPLVGLLIVPMVLLGSSLLYLVPSMGAGLLKLAAYGLVWLFDVLDRLSAMPFAQWNGSVDSVTTVILAGAGVVLLLAPRGLPARWLGGVMVLPVLFYSPVRPANGHAWLTLLDVGQGLAAVVQTRNHTLVFDTGPRFGQQFDTGQAVVVPFLRHQGGSRLDTLVISHGDSDHIGGTDSVMAVFPASRVLSSVPDKLAMWSAGNCHHGQSWTWDGVRFSMLHPGKLSVRQRNDASCVLRVTAGDHTVLLTGDIEKGAEHELLRRIPDQLDADILVAPHHGSNTSSTGAFIDAVSPDIVLFPVGYRNRFRFPHQKVIARYSAAGVTMLDTASTGAIQLRLGSDALIPRTYRQLARRYWHDP